MPINSDINIIGGIPDFTFIEVAFQLYSQGKGKLDLKELLVKVNAFDFRTESTRKKYLGAMHRSMFVFENENHKCLVEALFLHDGLDSLKHRVVFWQLLAGNELFRDISKEVAPSENEWVTYFTLNAGLTAEKSNFPVIR